MQISRDIDLYLGDCLELMESISDRSIDLVLCDLPYSITRCKWDTIIPFDKLWEQYNRVAKETTPFVLFGAEPFSSYLRISNIKNYKYDIVWDKVRGSGFLNVHKQPMRNHELISIFYRKQCIYNPQKTFGHVKKEAFRRRELQTEVYGKTKKDNYYNSTERYPRSIVTFSTDTQKSSLHPTQKPIALLEYLIKTYTNEGMTVLDNCMGSGSTAIACIDTNRKFIGMDIEKKYFDIATNRIKERLMEIGKY